MELCSILVLSDFKLEKNCRVHLVLSLLLELRTHGRLKSDTIDQSYCSELTFAHIQIKINSCS